MDKNDLIAAIKIGAAGYGGFLAIGVGCLIGYNIWNRDKVKREREAREGISGRLEKAGAQSDTSSVIGSWLSGSSYTRRSQQSRASSTPSLSESAINVYQGRRQSSQSILNNENPRLDGNHKQQVSGQTMPPLVEDIDENKIGLALGGEESNRGQQRKSVDSRDLWEL
ncbi:hypothetical protein Daus18300_007959 [Diaporthe australafricana]|uniref:Uncharacterized protein n=1 Tax=Diaporthe australafricana TaxID=127596 RepID=A0ABR3WK24_9PEZI